MIFQNPSFKNFLNGRTNGRTIKRTSRKQYAPHFFKVGGIKILSSQLPFCQQLSFLASNVFMQLSNVPVM